MSRAEGSKNENVKTQTLKPSFPGLNLAMLLVNYVTLSKIPFYELVSFICIMEIKECLF